MGYEPIDYGSFSIDFLLEYGSNIIASEVRHTFEVVRHTFEVVRHAFEVVCHAFEVVCQCFLVFFGIWAMVFCFRDAFFYCCDVFFCFLSAFLRCFVRYFL